ncbi:S-layer homology domain-containing protein [Lysinibacillus sp. FSL R5-0849]|uniref:S-layer homology domain-containing protein n=1 Tax=Lysinibacillus sp. FSL R5-0849 TaxID=2921660 RepID=UPI00315A2372
MKSWREKERTAKVTDKTEKVTDSGAKVTDKALNVTERKTNKLENFQIHSIFPNVYIKLKGKPLNFYINGGRVIMTKKKSKFFMAATSAVAITAVAVVPASAASPFKDVSEDYAHYKSISTLYAADIINGFPDGTFKPTQDVTRGQAVKMIAVAFDLTTTDVENPNFKDVDSTSPYYKAIVTLVNLGVVNGYEDDTFRPDETITRGQMAVMVAQATGLTAEGKSPFTDVPQTSPFADAVTALHEAGIAKGVTATEFGVDKNVTRGQLATFIVNALGLEQPSTGEDKEPVTEEKPEANDHALLEEVFTKALAKQKELKSMKATMTMSQSVEAKDGQETMKMDSKGNMKMEIVTEPMQFFADGTMSLTEPTSGEAINLPIKMYMTAKDGMYMYEAEQKAWVKFPKQLFEDVLSQTGMQPDAAEQLEMLQSFAEDFTLKETADRYELTLKGSGDKFTELVKQQIGAMDLGMDADLDGQLGNMSFDSLTYKLVINKKTFNVEEIAMDMSLSMKVEGNTIKTKQQMSIKYHDFNAVTTITIPKDVLDNAKEIDLSTPETVPPVSK